MLKNPRDLDALKPEHQVVVGEEVHRGTWEDIRDHSTCEADTGDELRMEEDAKGTQAWGRK